MRPYKSEAGRSDAREKPERPCFRCDGSGIEPGTHTMDFSRTPPKCIECNGAGTFFRRAATASQAEGGAANKQAETQPAPRHTAAPSPGDPGETVETAPPSPATGCDNCGPEGLCGFDDSDDCSCCCHDDTPANPPGKPDSSPAETAPRREVWIKFDALGYVDQARIGPPIDTRFFRIYVPADEAKRALVDVRHQAASLARDAVNLRTDNARLLAERNEARAEAKAAETTYRNTIATMVQREAFEQERRRAEKAEAEAEKLRTDLRCAEQTIADRTRALAVEVNEAEGAKRENDRLKEALREKLVAEGEDTMRLILALRARVQELEAGLRAFEQCVAWSDTMQQWHLIGRERVQPVLAQARALLAQGGDEQGSGKGGAKR